MSLKLFKLFILSVGLLSIIGCQTKQQQTCLQIQQQTLHYPNTLRLADYQVTINKKKIKGIANNFSALTWNKDTNTLFGTLNKPPTIVELSTEGELLRTIITRGIRDPEAIEYIGNEQYIIADERHHKLLKVTIDKETVAINGHLAPQAKIGEINIYNRGLEGLAYDNKNHIIYASNESDPITIYKVTGFIEDNKELAVTEMQRDWSLLINDISGLHFYQPYNNLLVLSDESKLLLEVNQQEQIIGCMPLTIGRHGLLRSIRQPEGVAMDGQGNLYIASEPNFFYKFQKRTR